MKRSKLKEPTPPPGLAEFVAKIAAGPSMRSADVIMEEYRKQWRAANEGGDYHLAPTMPMVAKALGIPDKTLSKKVRAMHSAGRLIRLGNDPVNIRYVPDEPEFTSALPTEEKP